MQDCTFSNYLRLVDADVSLSGAVHFAQPFEIGGWHSSSVRRSFEVLVRNARGTPVSHAVMRVMDPTGREVSKGTTTADGRFLFQVTFGDDSHNRTWKLTLPDYGVTKSFSFLTDTPLVVQVP
jgi:hypothetical protein